MRDFLRRNTPPGISVRGSMTYIVVWLSLAAFFSLGFFVSFGNAYSAMYEYYLGERVLREGAKMSAFDFLMGPFVMAFPLAAVAMLLLVGAHYAYYRQGSMSIYLMRRLPNRMEQHRRALTLPILGALAILVTYVILRLLYFSIYLLATPDVCLPPDAWAQFWRIF